ERPLGSPNSGAAVPHHQRTDFSQQALDRLTIAVDGGAYKSVQPVPHVGHRRQQPRCYALSDLKFPADFACAARGAEVTVPGNDLTLNGEWEQQGSVVTFSHLPEIGGKGVCRGESGRFGDHCPDEKRRPGRRGEPRRRTVCRRASSCRSARFLLFVLVVHRATRGVFRVTSAGNRTGSAPQEVTRITALQITPDFDRRPRRTPPDRTTTSAQVG